MKKGLKIFLIVFVVLILVLIVSFVGLIVWYKNNLEPVNKNGKGEDIIIEIEKKTKTTNIAENLEKNKIIKNSKAFLIYLKMNKNTILQAGKYKFNNKEDDVEAVVNKLAKGDTLDDSVKITFIEGKSIKDYAKLIADNTNNTLEGVFDVINNEEYINSLIEKYWFITDEIKDKDIYYSLEGYLRPDTYIFENKDISVEKIFNQVLDYTDKLLENYKEQIENTGYSAHQILTLASIIEKEASNNEDMPGISGVFYNRLKSKMSLGSDVTTYYAYQVDLSESDLSSEQISSYNPYNTRGPNMNGKLPIGPICNPSINALEAAITPEQNKYYYFVSDKTGKTYFSENYNEHQKIIKQLKKDDLWYTYE